MSRLRVTIVMAMTFVLAVQFLLPDGAAHDSGVEQLRFVQQQIQRVVTEARPACVAIGDGIGFGSGVVVNSSGLILTAGHVVNTGKTELQVYFPDGRIVPARLVGYNLDVDAAMIQITGTGTWPHVSLAESTAHLTPGDWLISLGHSGGYEVGRKPPVRSGRLIERRGHLLVTDAVLIGGDSGGPLFDLSGKLVAIHSSIGDTIAENRHVAIDVFHRDWRRLAAGQRWGKLPDLDAPGPQPETDSLPESISQLPLLGVTVAERNGQIVVHNVLPNSPAQRVGMKPRDVIRMIDGQSVRTVPAAFAIFQRKSAGQSVALRIERNGRPLNLQIILDRLK